MDTWNLTIENTEFKVPPAGPATANTLRPQPGKEPFCVMYQYARDAACALPVFAGSNACFADPVDCENFISDVKRPVAGTRTRKQ